MAKYIGYMRKIIFYIVLALLFVPLLVSGHFFFPYVFFKAIYFRILVLTGVLIAAYLLWKNQLYLIKKNAMLVSLWIFLLLLPLSSIFSVERGDSLWGGFERMEGAFYYVFLALFLFLLLQVMLVEKNWHKLANFLGIINYLIVFFALGQKLGFSFWFAEYGGRIGGTVGNAAYLASVLLMILVLLSFFFYKFYVDVNKRWFFGLGILFNLLAIFISATRASILALFVSFLLALVVALLKKNFLVKKQKIAILSLFLLIVFFTSLIFVFKETSLIKNIEPLRRLSSISVSEATSFSRLVTWQYAWQGYQEKPIFGWGLENFDLVFNKYFDGRVIENWFDRAHNNYLDILLSGGTFSLLAYLFFVGAVFYSIRRLYKNNKIDFTVYLIFTFGWLAYLIQNIFIFDTLNTLIFVLVFVALIYYLNQAGDRHTDWQPDKLKLKIIKFSSLGFLLALTLFLFIFTVAYPVNANRKFIQALDSSDSLEFKNLTNQALVYPYFSLYNKEMLIFASDQVRSQITKKDDSNADWLIAVLENYPHKDIKSYLDLSTLYLQRYAVTKDKALLEKNEQNLLSLEADNPNRFMLFGQLGKTYISLKNKEQAEKYLKLAYELKSDDQRVWDLIQLYIYFDDQYSLRHYTRVLLELDTNLSKFSVDDLLQYFQSIGDNEFVEKILLKLAIEQPKNAKIFYNLSIVQFKLGNLNEAALNAQKAIDIDPSMQEKLEKLFGIKQ